MEVGELEGGAREEAKQGGGGESVFISMLHTKQQVLPSFTSGLLVSPSIPQAHRRPPPSPTTDRLSPPHGDVHGIPTGLEDK